jgi:ATP synthase protein I
MRPPTGRGQLDLQEFGEQVDRKERRKIRGREEKKRSPLFWVGLWGLVGWTVSIPTAAGIWLGIQMDERWPDGPSWTLTGLIVGLVVGCITAWLWVRREITRES